MNNTHYDDDMSKKLNTPNSKVGATILVTILFLAIFLPGICSSLNSSHDEDLTLTKQQKAMFLNNSFCDSVGTYHYTLRRDSAGYVLDLLDHDKGSQTFHVRMNDGAMDTTTNDILFAEKGTSDIRRIVLTFNTDSSGAPLLHSTYPTEYTAEGVEVELEDTVLMPCKEPEPEPQGKVYPVPEVQQPPLTEKG